MNNRSKRDTKKINYKKLNDSGMADVGEHNLKIEKSTKVTQLEATAEEHVNKNGVLQLLEDDEIDEDELSHMKEEIENLKRQEEQLRKKQDFHETKKQLEKQKAKIESLKGKVKVLSNGNTYSKTKSKSSKKSDHEHKLTIDDLRKDKLLTNKVKKQISKLGLIDESLSESDVDSESIYNFSEQESVHSESDGDSSFNSEISQISSKRSVKAIKSKKSGIAIKKSISPSAVVLYTCLVKAEYFNSPVYLGHTDVVENFLEHGADTEAQSERTKDTPLSLACSWGRNEVVELSQCRGANKKHRNVSDYTPLSLAALGGFVNKVLLSHGAEINSRTGSKLGISPLMLAAINGQTAEVKLNMDTGSDINAQIETGRNTAHTLACSHCRHEVVSLLVDRRANIEHRAKTGLTLLMEAASGGDVEVGRVLLDKGADVNASPVPSFMDTALTIAADKGNYGFEALLLSRHAAVDIKNKKGNSPLWVACNGGHLDVVQLLVTAGADIDSQDNGKVSCLMAAFMKGHVDIAQWMVTHVNQFPSATELSRYIQTVADKIIGVNYTEMCTPFVADFNPLVYLGHTDVVENFLEHGAEIEAQSERTKDTPLLLACSGGRNEDLQKCQQCFEIIVQAKDRQAAEANKNENILLEQLDKERQEEENRRAVAAKKREKKKKKKQKQESTKDNENESNSKNSGPEPGAKGTHCIKLQVKSNEGEVIIQPHSTTSTLVDMQSGKDEVKESGQMPLLMPVQSFGKRHNHLKKRSAGDAKRSVVVRRTNITKVFCKFARASFVGLFMLTQMPCANSCPPYLSDHQVAVGGNHTACLQLTSGIDYAVYVDDFFIGLCNLFNGLGQGSVENEYHNNYQVSVNNTDCCVTLYKVSCGDKSICAKATGINNSVCCSLPVQCYPHVDHDNNVPVWVPVLVSFAVVSAVALLMILIWCICKNKSKKMYPQLRNSMFYHKV